MKIQEKIIMAFIILIVEIYKNNKLVDTKVNLTGLPIWYSSMDKFRYDKFDDPIALDLILLMDSIENLLSKLDDAVTTLSLNPLGVVSGQRIESNINMLYQYTDNIARQYIASLLEGFYTRLAYIRKLMELKDIHVSDEVFDSINISFNVNCPVDNKSDIENMKMQYECDSLSKQTIIDRLPYVTNTSLELERIEVESMKEAVISKNIINENDILDNKKGAEELIISWINYIKNEDAKNIPIS